MNKQKIFMVSDLQITIYQRNVIENITNFIRLNIFVALKYSSVQIPSYIYILSHIKSLLKF